MRFSRGTDFYLICLTTARSGKTIAISILFTALYSFIAGFETNPKNLGVGVEHRGVRVWNVRNKPKTNKKYFQYLFLFLTF